MTSPHPEPRPWRLKTHTMLPGERTVTVVDRNGMPDPVHRARIELLLAEEETTLARALVEIGKGTYGASNYVEHHRRMVGGYRRMLAIHDNPDIEDGDVVQMEPEPERRGLLEDAQLV